MPKVIEVTDRTFEDEVLNSDVPAEVDFWAPWCGPCRMVSPIYDKLAGQYDNFKFCKINVDENVAVAQKYGIQSIPMQMFFADGEKVDEILGAVPEHMIKSKVDEVIRRYPTDERGRLKSIISSWVKQNNNSLEKFGNLQKKADDIKNEPSYKSIEMAVEEMKGVNEKLSQLLKEL